MKKLTTLLTAVGVILLTVSFAIAEGVSIATGTFPFFQLGCLIIGGICIISLKNKYEKIYTSEAIGIFALYTLLISLFTNPVIGIVKNLFM